MLFIWFRVSLSAFLCLASKNSCLCCLFLTLLITQVSLIFLIFFCLRGLGFSKSITSSIISSICYFLGLQECPDDGLIIAGTISSCFFLVLGCDVLVHRSCMPSSIRLSLLQELSYLGLGCDFSRFLNRSGFNSYLSLLRVSSTMRGFAYLRLVSSMLSFYIFYSKPDTSMFLFHFFLFCFPLRPLFITSPSKSISPISVNNYNQISQQPITKRIMVVYWKFLYKPKTPNQPQLDTLSRHLAFKLPIVLRYNIGFAVLFGMVHATIAGNRKWMLRYFYLIPLGIAGLCYEDIWKYLEIKGLVARRQPVEEPVSYIKKPVPPPQKNEEKVIIIPPKQPSKLIF